MLAERKGAVARGWDGVRWKLRSWRGLPGREEMVSRYWAVVEPALSAHADSFTREQAQTFLEPWLESVSFSRGPLRDGWPWMAFPAIAHLQSLLTPKSRVFEYGAGGSSIFFSSRVGELVSVEHDRGWYEHTARAMKRRTWAGRVRWNGVLAEPSAGGEGSDLPPTDPLSYASTDAAYAGMSFRNYASVIDGYPDRHFDVVLIDGRARPSCFLHAMSKVRFGGWVVLDNAERESYAWIEDTALKLGFERTEFWGPGPYNDYCWRTIFLRRTRDRFALNDLDTKLEQWLDFDGGTFVEAGANDGIQQSNTLYFESRRGWQGVLVEAIPELYEQCRRHRPHAKVVWAALGAPEQVPGTAKLRFAGLMSLVRGAMRSQGEEDSHVQAGQDVQRLPATYEVEAPYATLGDVLDRCGIHQVDLLSLDLEGYEAQALAGLVSSRHRPRFILVEARFREEIEALLLPIYEHVADLSHHDVLYRLRTLN